MGAGRMGTAMALRLLDQGCDLAAYNRTRAKLDALVGAGAKPVDSPADLATRDIVFVTVGSSEDLLAVLDSEAGLLSGGSVPSVVVDCSTVSTEASADARALLEARGAAFLAAPVSGNPKVVAGGKLTMAVSGPREAFEVAEPYLAMIGRGVTYVGGGEVARLVKICHNLLLGVVIQSLTEILVLAEKGGVRRQDLLAFVNDSVMGSLFTRYKSPALVNLDFTPTFTTKLLRKDFDLGLAAARESGVSMPVAALVHEIVQAGIGEGLGDDDFASLLLVTARAAGLGLTSEETAVADGLSAGATT
ncbi:MAG: NAD(P)-dependent oxidoreductase [Actinomycetota bacterium]|nr:NAD(P)-dependent oxidoreductase [Actinomycetota bacterium]